MTVIAIKNIISNDKAANSAISLAFFLTVVPYGSELAQIAKMLKTTLQFQNAK